MRKSIDLGINLIDTSNTYVKGKSEEIVGKAIQDYRDEVIVASKVGMNIGQGPNQTGLSRKHIMWQIKHSLESLKTDFVDIYYIHRFDPETPFEETIRTFNDLIHEGKIRYMACSNFTALQISNAHEICEKHDFEKFVAVQPPYNLLQREIEKELLPYCEKEGLGALTYTPLMGGFLTGKYAKDSSPPPSSRAEYNPNYWERVNREDNFEVLQQISKLAEDFHVPISKLAIAWILKNPLITAPIVGASTVEQVEENCGIPEIRIPDEVYRKMDEITES